MSVYKALERVRDIILEYGWQSGEYGNEHDGYCTLGAFSACGYDISQVNINDYAEPLRLFHDSIDKEYSSSIIRWNDGSGTTKDDVIAHFNKLIAEHKPVVVDVVVEDVVVEEVTVEVEDYVCV